MSWAIASHERTKWGRVQVIIDGQDVSYFRDTPARLTSLSYGEPFDDKHAVIELPQVSALEAYETGNLSWLRPWAPVEIYRIPESYVDADDALIIFEGFVASFSSNHQQDSSTTRIECMGALYQADLYVRAPVYPTRLHPMEVVIGYNLVWNPDTRPHLMTTQSKWDYPDGWSKTNDVGELWCGHESKETGSWNRLLSEYVADHLSGMVNLPDPENPGFEGTQWTLMMDSPGRVPVYQVKNWYEDPGATAHDTSASHTFSCGTPGITHDLSHDWSQSYTTIYGEGKDAAGIVWRNANRAPGSAHTGYTPLANADPSYLDVLDNFRVETHQTYGGGVSLLDAQESAQKQLDRDMTPGWHGTITMKSDPESFDILIAGGGSITIHPSRFDIRAGENIIYRYFAGSGSTGTLFHIAQVEHDFESGQTTLTVDTKARDQATLASVLERKAADAIYPTRTLVPVTRARLTDDEKFPWDYEMGSGYIPTGYKDFRGSHTTAGNRPQDDAGYADALATASDPNANEYDPRKRLDYYVYVNGSNSDPVRRWTFFPIIVANKFTVEKVSLTAYNANGTINSSCRFHWGLYKYDPGGIGQMPFDENGVPNPLGPGAFDPGNNLTEVFTPLRVISWGQENQACGYWPGLETNGDPTTGQFVDEGTWEFTHDPGQGEFWVAIYATSDAFFSGRITHSSHVPFEELYADEVV